MNCDSAVFAFSHHVITSSNKIMKHTNESALGHLENWNSKIGIRKSSFDV